MRREPYPSRNTVAPLYLLLGLAVILSVSAKGLSFHWRGTGFSISSLMLFLAWLTATAVLVSVALRRRVSPASVLRGDNYWMPLVLLAGLLLFVASDIRKDQWFFFLDPRSFLWLVLLTPVLAPVMEVVERKRLGRIVYPLLLIAAQAYLAWVLISTTGGHPLYRDDHPSFLYRLWLIKESFPRIFFYNPFWNGGYIGTELVATGSLALGYLAMPFTAIFGIENVYTPILVVIFIGAIPWITYLTIRSLGVDRLPAYLAAFLSLGTNRYFFLNFLTFGTTPSLLISFLVVTVWALLYAAVKLGRIGPGRWLALVISLNLMIFWPPSILILSPVGLSLLASAGSFNGRKLAFIITAAFFLTLINGWWLYRYVTHPNLVGFITHEITETVPFQLSRVFTSLSGMLKQTNPLILAAGFLGLIIPGRKSEYRWLLPPAAVYLLAMAIGQQYKPQIQLHRMIIPLSFFLLVPAALIMEQTMSRRDLPSFLARGGAAAMIIMTVMSVGGLFQNRGTETFWTMSKDMRNLVSWIRENVPPEGRIFFAGSTVHGYGGGHVAYLQALTGRSMIAGDYYHFDPSLRDYNPVPAHFRGSVKKNVDYLKLMGVTHVVSYHRPWKDIMSRRKRFRFGGAFGAKEIYSTGVAPGLFYTGEGEIEMSINRIKVDLDGPREEIVLRFLWNDDLRADPPVKLVPVEVAPGVTFIGVRPGGATSFSLY